MCQLATLGKRIKELEHTLKKINDLNDKEIKKYGPCGTSLQIKELLYWALPVEEFEPPLISDDGPRVENLRAMSDCYATNGANND